MKIRGNTVGTTLPKPNLDQTDPTKGDYIKGDRSFAKGDPGYTPVKGTDYYTEEEKTELIEEVLDSLNLVSAIDFTNFSSGSFTEVVDGETITHTVTFDEKGNPKTIDGISLTFPA